MSTAFRRRTAIVLGMALLAVYVVVQWDTYRLEQELQVIADSKASEAAAWVRDVPARVATSVAASRSGVVLGAAQGKVSVFVERGESTHIEGYEYFFAREDSGSWRQTESGRCTSEQCSIEGRKLMKALDEAP